MVRKPRRATAGRSRVERPGNLCTKDPTVDTSTQHRRQALRFPLTSTFELRWKSGCKGCAKGRPIAPVSERAYTIRIKGHRPSGPETLICLVVLAFYF